MDAQENSSFVLIDTHSHLELEDYFQDLNSVILRAQEKGVKKIITVGTDPQSNKKAIEIANRYNNIYAAVGLHPHEADNTTNEHIQELITLLSYPKVIAIGETGLDYYKKFSSAQNQKHLFLSHIQLAIKLQKPIIIHCREAHKDCQEILKGEMPKPIKGIMHCFSGTKVDAKDYLDMGLYISLAGPLTFPNAHNLREVTKTIPFDRLLIETDSPYLAPQIHRGKRNEPAYVIYVAQALAEILGTSLEEVAEQTTQNTLNLFGKIL